MVEQVLSEREGLAKKNLRLTPKRLELTKLAKKVISKATDVSQGELRSWSRRREKV